MSAVTLADQAGTLRTLADVAEAFAHLPAAYVAVAPESPDCLEISVHNDLAAFEAWRVALGIQPATVELRVLSTCMCLKGAGAFSGTSVALTGYAPLLPGGGL